MTPSKQIDALFAKYPPDIQKQAQACRLKLRKRLPTALELVYDYGFQLVFSFGATENGSQALVGLAVTPKGIALYVSGADLPDPEKRLGGSGKQARKLPLESAASLNDPYVGQLIDAAVASAKVPLDPKAKRRVVIKSKRKPGKK